MEHHDNRGGHRVLKPGDVQWMTARRRILHLEMAYRKQQVHTLQLWLNLSAESKMVEPTYQDLRGDKVPVRLEPGVEVRLFSGRSGDIEATSKVSKYVPVTMLDIRLDGDEAISFTQEIPTGDEGFVYVISGRGYFSSNDTLVSAGQVGHLTHTSTTDWLTILNVLAKEPMRFLLWTGKPLRPPGLALGPFVMNTEGQIAEAFTDYRAGLFDSIPRQQSTRVQSIPV